MPKIFISYRRESAEADAGRLGDRLKNKFGADSVFVDVENLTPGVNFPDHLKDVLCDCLVMVVVIDKNWTARDNESLDWLADSNFDFVAYEIEVALHNNLKIVPVLINSAKMPQAAILPVKIKKLAQHHAANLRGESYESDSNALIFLIENYMTQLNSEFEHKVEKRRSSESILNSLDFSGSALRFEHVSLVSRLGGREVKILSDITFGIDSGVMLAVGGMAGSGKTTLLRVAALLQNPTEGSVIIGGVYTSGCSDKDIYHIKKNLVRFVGVVTNLGERANLSKVLEVFSNYLLFRKILLHIAGYFKVVDGCLTVMDCLSVVSKKYGSINKINDEDVCCLLRQFELFSVRNVKVRELPPKLLQRLEFVKAFLGEPKLLLVDAVAARIACDANFNIFQKLKTISESRNITLVLEAPTKKDIQYCNRLMTLEDGAVSSFGVKSAGGGWSLARVRNFDYEEID